MVKMIVVNLVAFLVFYSPYMLIMQIVFRDTQKSHPQWVYRYVVPTGQWIMTLYACVNPIIYAWINEDYRRAYTNLLRMFPKTFPAVQPNENTMNSTLN
jgi:hypothetical protein